MATKRALPAATEVDAYIFIKQSLRELGWDIRNPHRCATGRVYTQNECLEHPDIKKYLGLERPENVVVVSQTALWVIEAKRDQQQLAQAVKEAEGYARKINQGRNVTAKFISGVAGNEATGYLVQTHYLVN